MNPLIEKYLELHPENDEKKKVHIKNEITDEVVGEFEYDDKTLKKLPGPGKYTPLSLGCYDTETTNQSFFEVSDKIKNGKANVSCVSIQQDNYGVFNAGYKITFEVYVYDF